MRCFFCGRIIAEIYKMSYEDVTLVEIPCARCKKVNIIDFKDQWIYFKEGGYLSKIKVDGTEKTILDKDWLQNIILQGDWIYYIDFQDQSKIYKMKNDGSEKQAITPYAVNEMIVVGNWVYHTDFVGNLYCISINGSDYKRIQLDDRISSLLGMIGDSLYFTGKAGQTKSTKIPKPIYTGEKTETHTSE